MFHGRITMFHELLEAFHGFAMFHALEFRPHFRKTDPSLPLSDASAAFAPRSTARGATACAPALPPLLRQCQQPTLRWPVRLRLRLALPLFPAHSTADNAHALLIRDTHAERAHDEQVAVGAIKLLGFIEGRIVHPGLVGSQLGPPVLPRWGAPAPQSSRRPASNAPDFLCTRAMRSSREEVASRKTTVLPFIILCTFPILAPEGRLPCVKPMLLRPIEAQ